MLLCLIAFALMSLSAGTKWLLSDSTQIALNNPSTLQLAIIGIATIAVYSLARRFRGPRKSVPTAMTGDGRALADTANDSAVPGDEPKRGAA